MIVLLNDNGQKVFDARYADRDKQGNIIETFEQAVDRVVKAAVQVETDKDTYSKLFTGAIANLELIPSTPIWANIGKTDRPWQPGACFVLDVDDTLEDMYRALKDTAMIFKSGGGVGYNFSNIRPKGALVNSTKGQASGVVELIKLYDASSNMVMQGGVRRGASMGILNINHPEIIDFINCKRNGGITNFNLSVGVTDTFMTRLAHDEDWSLSFNGKVYKIMKARELWDMIAESAHACGDPGIIFLDAIQRNNPVPGKVMNKTNPCGEQPLYDGESCLLLSINLTKVIKDGNLQVSKLRSLTELAVRFLDNLIDVAEYPLPLIEENTKATRKIGVGFTGLHDALIMMGQAYNSEEGRQTAADIARIIRDSAVRGSVELAKTRGVFPDWDKSIYRQLDIKTRNASMVTIAPTGSVTAMAGCEGYGVEPLFGIAYKKSTNVAGDFYVFSNLFKDACEKLNVSKGAMEEAARKGSCQGVKGIPVELQRLFVCAQDISYTDHILMQAAVQGGIDNAVSKTINMPSTVSVQDVLKAYQLAYDEGCKGITIYRDGCKEGVITVGEKEETIIQGITTESIMPARGEVVPRPTVTEGVTRRLDTGCGKLYLTANFGDDGEIIETFITTGSDGGCLIFTEATSRLISLAIRGGISIQEIVSQLKSTHPCPAYMMASCRGRKVSKGKSCASAIANVLEEIQDTATPSGITIVPNNLMFNCASEKVLPGPVKVKVEDKEFTVPNITLSPVESNIGKHITPKRSELGPCPVCGGHTIKIEGCTSCPECGFSKC